MENIKVICNLKSGAGNGQKQVIKLIEELNKHRLSFTTEITQYKGHAREIAQKTKHAIIIVVGGDGTLHEVASGVSSHNKSIIAFVPSGTGNDFYLAWTKGKTIEETVKSIINKEITTIPIFKYEDLIDSSKDIILNNMGIGFDALINVEASKLQSNLLKSKSLYKHSYKLSTLKSLNKISSFDLILNGKIVKNVVLSMLSNIPNSGGGIEWNKNVKKENHEIVYTYFNNIKLFDVGDLLFKFLVSKTPNKSKNFNEFKSEKELEIEIPTAVFVHVDGENLGYRERHFKISLSELKVII